MDSRHSLVSRFFGLLDSGDLVWVAERLDSSVASPAVGVNDRSGLDRRYDEPLEIGSVSSVDPLHTDTTGARAVFLGGNRNKAFARRSPATNATCTLPFMTAYVGLIDLNASRQPFPPRTNHGSPQLVQPRPRRLVAAQTPSTRWSPSALTPVFWLVTHHIARNHIRSGFRVPSKTVPAVIEVCRWQPEHSIRSPRPIGQARCPPQAGQRNPSGHRSFIKYARHAASETKRPSNSPTLRG